MRHVLSTFVAAGVVWAALGVPSSAGAENYRWYEVRDGQVRLDVYVFWSKTCPHCHEAWDFLGELRKRHPWLNLYSYEITGKPANRELYQRMAASLNYQTAGQVPAVFYCKRLSIGFTSPESTGKQIEDGLVGCRNALQRQLEGRANPPPRAEGDGSDDVVRVITLLSGMGDEGPTIPVQEAPPPPAGEEAVELDLDEALPAEEESFEVPGWGEVKTEEVSLPAFTIVIAGMDAFNPCAFFVLMILLSIMLRSRSRGHMLLVGGVFVFFSGLMYFLFMAAWLNLFFLVGHLRLITLGAGAIAVVAALINIKDYFWFKQGVSLSIPDSAKPGLFKRMNALVGSASLGTVLAGTASLAALANLYELMCTAGFPMIYTRVLTLQELPTWSYYLWLVAYNVVYVTPLALIVAGFALALASHRMTEYEGRVLKLLSGSMMLTLGVVLLVRPEWLNSLAGAALSLAVSIGLTALVVVIDRLRHRAATPTSVVDHARADGPA